MNFMTKAILKLGTSNLDFLVTARKQKEEKFPKLMDKKYKVIKDEVDNHKVFTMNAKTNNKKHILYFHGGSMCLNGTIAHHLFLDKLIKYTDVKTTYMLYPLIPQYKTSKIYSISAHMIKHMLKKYPNDEFILAGDSAGALVLLSAYQLLNDDEKEKIYKMILLSPWLDFSLSNDKMEDIEKNDFMLTVDQFKGLQKYNDIDKHKVCVTPLDYPYDKDIDIYVGTYDILYPDTLLFEKRNKHVDLMIFDKQPHVFALLPVKHAKTVVNHIIKQLNE